MRANLEEYPVPCLDDVPQRLVEEHGLPDIPIPIPCIQLRPRQRSTGHRGEEWRRCRPRPDIAQAFHQLLFELLHLRAVIRHVHLQGAAEHVRCIESLVDFGEHRGIARKRDRTGAVDGGYRNGLRMSFDQARGLLAGDPCRQHCTLSGRAVLQAAAVERDSNRILQRKHSGDVRRCHFTRAVTQDGGRLDAPRSP